MLSWNVEGSCETTAHSDKIWKLWSDVPNWPKWDDELEWCRLDGAFIAGTKGALKPKGAPQVRFVMTDVQLGRAYSAVSFLPLTKLYFTHTLEKLSNGKHLILHRASCKGLLAPLLWFTLRRAFKKGLPLTVRALATLAEES